jgi:TPR repeat protein
MSKSFITVPRLFLLCVLLALATPLLADSSDWVQVERFKKQLQQAEAGKVPAMFEVGRMYELGRGVDIDYATAVQWYQRAAEAGNADAKGRLGRLYLEGKGVPRNPGRAFRLLKEAAKHDIPSAQYELGRLYETGTGVERNLDAAVKWYQRAREGGDYRAEAALRKLQAQRRAAPPPAPAPKPAAVPLSEQILAASWEFRDKPAVWLPSSISKCQAEAKTIKCKAELSRETETEIITYRSEAILENFQNDTGTFQIRYVNTILDVKPKQATSGAFDENDIAAAGDSNLKPGHKTREQKLECQLQDAGHVLCKKGVLREYLLTAK